MKTSENVIQHILLKPSFSYIHISPKQGAEPQLTVLIAAVVGGIFVVTIAIIGIFCFVRKVQKNSTPGNTPVHSRPTSQQEQAEMTSVIKSAKIC